MLLLKAQDPLFRVRLGPKQVQTKCHCPFLFVFIYQYINIGEFVCDVENSGAGFGGLGGGRCKWTWDIFVLVDEKLL